MHHGLAYLVIQKMRPTTLHNCRSRRRQTAFIAHVVRILAMVGRMTNHLRRGAGAAKNANEPVAAFIRVVDSVTTSHVRVDFLGENNKVNDRGIVENRKRRLQRLIPRGECTRVLRHSQAKPLKKAMMNSTKQRIQKTLKGVQLLRPEETSSPQNPSL